MAGIYRLYSYRAAKLSTYNRVNRNRRMYYGAWFLAPSKWQVYTDRYSYRAAKLSTYTRVKRNRLMYYGARFLAPSK